MAIGLAKAANIIVRNGPVVYPASAGSSWVTANDSALTAQTAAMLLRPATITDSTFHWVKRGDCTSILFRAIAPVGATVTTDPVVRVIGAWGTPDTSGAFADDGTVKFLRLDNQDANAAGVTLDLFSSGASTLRDTTYQYSDPYSLTPTDLKGCDYFGIAVETVVAYSAGSGATPIEALLLN